MKHSTDRILTSHAGSLPRPQGLIEVNQAKLEGRALDEKTYEKRLQQAVDDACRKQAELGIDVINDGEFGKVTRGAIDYGAWSSYAWARLKGWEPGEARALPALTGRRDRQKFADFYREHDATSFLSSSMLQGRPPVFTGPISYTGHAMVKRDIANFKGALAQVKAEEGFITSVAPGSFARRQNQYYKTDEEFLFALGEAMRTECEAIIDAGLVLQLDDPGLPDTWDLANPEPEVGEYKKFAMVRIEALNHALRGLPENMIRYHICWGSWHGPHSTDLPLASIVDMLLKVKAGAFSIEAGNARHEHEWKVWRDVKMPEGKLLIPGVVSHATNVLEHPELIADRILRFAGGVGRENVIAGTDCGLGGRVHEQIAWAKLEALSDRARLASKQLWK
jgi:5-methyltetrahydropteroyltriglutamate--homocysteine methyltransferase